MLPAASAARTPPAGIENGKFHGGDTTTTPRGELATSQSSSANSDDSEPVPSAYHRAKSTASETSGSASSKVLPASEAITAIASARAGPAAITSAASMSSLARSAGPACSQSLTA